MVDALFGSKTRVKLLHLFLNNPNRSFYVREITRKIDEQINSVRRELANMLNIGVITTSENSANNRLYYEVNQQYAHYEPLRTIFADDNRVHTAGGVELSDWQKRLKPLGDVRLVIFSGSLAKGSHSQVDVLLVGALNKTQVKKLIKELEEEEGKPLNYVVLDYEDFYYRLSIKDRFVMDILSGEYTVVVDSEQILTEKTE